MNRQGAIDLILMIFIAYGVLSLVGLSLALSPTTGARGRHRLAAMALFLPLALKGLFALLPRLEADLMPVAGYSLVQRDGYMPLAVLFFGVASRLVPPASRRSVQLMTIFLVILCSCLGLWRLSAPATYASVRGVSEDGICHQSSAHTCAAASMVTLLHRMGITSEEGEMAELSHTIPGRGASFFQVAMGLRRKLEQQGRPESACLLTPGNDELETLRTPFLTGVKLSLLIDHMVCVLSIEAETVTIADPLEGRRVVSRESFLADWLGIVVVVE